MEERVNHLLAAATLMYRDAPEAARLYVQQAVALAGREGLSEEVKAKVCMGCYSPVLSGLQARTRVVRVSARSQKRARTKAASMSHQGVRSSGILKNVLRTQCKICNLVFERPLAKLPPPQSKVPKPSFPTTPVASTTKKTSKSSSKSLSKARRPNTSTDSPSTHPARSTTTTTSTTSHADVDDVDEPPKKKKKKNRRRSSLKALVRKKATKDDGKSLSAFLSLL